ncbi:hypothetical protein [Sporosarcina sp.]|uniref:hypothetical protein n=1 Tax=Sporosarcina sp. TaxID=49982 RepID=UPI00260415F2|nr:hypothetical protein [Sporosarcina sp.]
MDLTKLKNNNLLKVGAAAILSIGVLSACGDDKDDPVIDNNDDVDIDQPADTTPNDDVDVDMEPDADVDMDVDMKDEEDGDTKATN